VSVAFCSIIAFTSNCILFFFTKLFVFVVVALFSCYFKEYLQRKTNSDKYPRNSRMLALIESTQLDEFDESLPLSNCIASPPNVRIKLEPADDAIDENNWSVRKEAQAEVNGKLKRNSSSWSSSSSSKSKLVKRRNLRSPSIDDKRASAPELELEPEPEPEPEPMASNYEELDIKHQCNHSFYDTDIQEEVGELTPPSIRQSLPACLEHTRNGKANKFTNWQLSHLNQSFAKSAYIVGTAKAELAARVGLTPCQVSKWFEHKRYRLKLKNIRAIGSTDMMASDDNSQSKQPRRRKQTARKSTTYKRVRLGVRSNAGNRRSLPAHLIQSQSNYEKHRTIDNTNLGNVL
jgi:hypothetical protein